MAKQKTYLVEAGALDGTNISITEFSAEGADEYVTIQNGGTMAQPLTSWALASLRGESIYEFPDGLILHPNSRVRIHSGPGAQGSPPGDWVWTREKIWNDQGDVAVLFDARGHEVARLSHGTPPPATRNAKLLYRDEDGIRIEDSGPHKAVNRKLGSPSSEEG